MTPTDLTTTDTSTVVLATVDIDCDGTGYAWQRVTVPRELADALEAELVALREHNAEAERVLTGTMAAIRAGQANPGSLQHALDAKDKSERRARYHAGTLRRLESWLTWWLLATEQPGAGSDWHPLTRAEVVELEASLALNRFDLDYWHEQGYASQFNSR